MPKAQKRQSSCQSFFALSGSVRIKAACRMLMKLTPEINYLTSFNIVEPKSGKLPVSGSRLEK